MTPSVHVLSGSSPSLPHSQVEALILVSPLTSPGVWRPPGAGGGAGGSRTLPQPRPVPAGEQASPGLPSQSWEEKENFLTWGVSTERWGGREMTSEPIHFEKVLRDFRFTNGGGGGLSQHSPNLEEDAWRAGARRTRDPLRL